MKTCTAPIVNNVPATPEYLTYQIGFFKHLDRGVGTIAAAVVRPGDAGTKIGCPMRL
jgi:hypothetical protein